MGTGERLYFKLELTLSIPVLVQLLAAEGWMGQYDGDTRCLSLPLCDKHAVPLPCHATAEQHSLWCWTTDEKR